MSASSFTVCHGNRHHARLFPAKTSRPIQAYRFTRGAARARPGTSFVGRCCPVGHGRAHQGSLMRPERNLFVDPLCPSSPSYRANACRAVGRRQLPRRLLRTPLDLIDQRNNVQFARPSFNLNGTRVLGNELDTGTIDANGKLHLTSISPDELHWRMLCRHS